MTVTVEELNGTPCKTYLLASADEAVLVDPVRERFETYRALLAQRNLKLRWVLETHTHADHLMITSAMKDALGAPYVMHEKSPSPLVDRHVRGGDSIQFGDVVVSIVESPGHTPDSVAYIVPGAVLTGDVLLIGGSGRTDFPGGDAGAQYDAVTNLLFALPDDTVVWPGHDYKGRTSSTIGQEKRDNARFHGKSRAEYITLMGNLGLPFPEKIQQSLQVNQSGFEVDQVGFPSVHEVAKVPELSAQEIAAKLREGDRPLVLDVREPEEFVGELGHVEGALLVPLDALERRLPKLAGYVDRPVVLACRAGARSATAAAILRRAGFRNVMNLRGGMLAWKAAGFPVQR
jgi:glyoxylase-like metal-dependent hydrolase (beta-lactamase superfamily II)/rhodanese-related sulfurtransferase